MAMTKVKKLQLWCKQMAEGYPEVTVTDMTSSWKNGLAFCAIIHRFRPDLIDFDSLSKENVYENNQLAFEVAENELDIPAFLEAEDMVAIRVPDKLSVVTYVSQYYNYFHNKPQLGGPTVKKASSLKRHQGPDDSLGPQPKRSTPQNTAKTTERKIQGSIGDKCTICHEKVYLMERLMENNKLYHRTCFRQSDLSPTSKIFTRGVSPGGPEPRRGRDSEKSRNLMARLNEMKQNTASINSSGDQSKTSNPMPKPSMPLWKQSHSDTVSNSIGTRQSSHEVSPIRNVAEKMDTSVGDKSPGAKIGDKSPGAKKGDKSPGAKIGDKSQGAKVLDKFLGAKMKDESQNAKVEEKSLVSPGTKPKAKPRGSIKSKEDSKSVKTEGIEAPPRKKSSKSVPSDKTSNAESPPALPTSSPPPLPNTNPPSPALWSSTTTNTKGLPTSPRDKPLSELNSSHKPSSPPRFKSPSASPREASKSPVITNRNRTASPEILQTDPKPVKNSSVLHSNIKKDPSIDNAPPKPPRSLPRGTTPKDMEQAAKSSDHVSSSVEQTIPGTKAHKDQSENVLSGLLQNLANVRHKANHSASDNSWKHDNKLGELNKPHTSHSDRPATSPDRANLNTPDTSHSDRLVTTPDRAKPRVMRRAVIKSEVMSDTSTRDKDTKRPITQTGGKNNGITASDKIENKPVKEIKSGDQVPAWKNRGNLKAETDQNVPAWKNRGNLLAESDQNVPAWKNRGNLKAETDQNVPAWKNRRNQQTDQNGGKYSWRDDNNATKSVENSLSVNSNNDDKKTTDKLGAKDKPARPKTPEFLSRKHIKDNISVSSRQTETEKKLANQDTDSHTGTNKSDLNKPTVRDNKSNKTSEIRNKLSPVPSEINTDTPGEQRKKKITVNIKFDFEEASSKPESPKSPRPPRPPQPSPHDIKEPRRSIKKHKAPNAPGSPGWLKDGDFRKMSPLEIQNQLVQIDSKLTDLEIRGRHLEDSIRKASEEDEGMMIEWFQMVNEKNELIRKEADLIYASRTQELEDEQQGIDRQIRELLQKPEEEKTEEEKQEEELLLQKLIDVVNQRSVIVDSQDEDRIRYQEEDRDIAVMLETKGFVQKTH